MRRRSFLCAMGLAPVVGVAAVKGLSPRSLVAQSASGLGISGLTANSSTIPLYGKFELTFNVDNTVATNLQFPYDPSPPAGLTGGTGITVDGLFLPPGVTDWSQAIVQPGFLYQDYQRQQINSTEWLYPQGNPVWKVRFAPTSQGAWQYVVRARDAASTTWVQSNAGSFTTGAPSPNNHGFVTTSQADPRYFECSDGQPFIGLGHNTSFSNRNFTYDVDAQFAQYAANGVDFLRIWMSGSPIAGSAWGPWNTVGGQEYGGYLPAPGLAIAPAGSGHDFTFFLDQSTNVLGIFNGFTQGPIAVKPNTTYQVSLTAQASNVAGPKNASYPNYGLTVKVGPWPDNFPASFASLPNLVPYIQNGGWTTVQGTFTTSASESFLDYLYVMLDNTTAGQANISQISLREVLSGGGLGPEILAKSVSDAHTSFNLPRSWDWDYAIDQAAQKGVYLKLVVLEKNDLVWNYIKPDGTLSVSTNNNNFYASPNTKVRRLHEYFWRYLAARWGYATSVHSWELMNEGDPANGNHFEMANSFAQEMHQLESRSHLITTSTWASFPAAQFWGNQQYPDIDYADLHAYISTGLGSYEWYPPSGTALDTNPANTYQGSAAALRVAGGVKSASRDVWVRGQGNWNISAMFKAQNIVGSCPYGAPPSLAGPQLMITLDGSSPTSTTRAIPYNLQNPNNYFTCTSPAGTYDYTKMSGVMPVPDANWHMLTLSFFNTYATSGSAWFDTLQVQSPDGRLARFYGDGTFDDRQRMDYDTALYTTIFSLLDGCKSVSGAGKPVVRGEAGIDYPGGPQTELPQLANDLKGVWLHNYLWGTLNPGGLYELYWWVSNIQNNNLYFQYTPVRNFLEGIPFTNGQYQDAQAQVSSTSVAAIGQKDLVNGRAHLWIRNLNHTWWNVVNNVAWSQLSGTVTVSGFAPNQSYPVEWWQFDDPGNLTMQEGTATSDGAGNLVLNLAALPSTVTDVAVKIGSYGQVYTQQLSPILK